MTNLKRCSLEWSLSRNSLSSLARMCNSNLSETLQDQLIRVWILISVLEVRFKILSSKLFMHFILIEWSLDLMLSMSQPFLSWKTFLTTSFVTHKTCANAPLSPAYHQHKQRLINTLYLNWFSIETLLFPQMYQASGWPSDTITSLPGTYKCLLLTNSHWLNNFLGLNDHRSLLTCRWQVVTTCNRSCRRLKFE